MDLVLYGGACKSAIQLEFQILIERLPSPSSRHWLCRVSLNKSGSPRRAPEEESLQVIRIEIHIDRSCGVFPPYSLDFSAH